MRTREEIAKDIERLDKYMMRMEQADDRFYTNGGYRDAMRDMRDLKKELQALDDLSG